MEGKEKSSNFERGLAASGIVAAISGSFMVWFFNPSTERFFPLCPLHTFTGLSCPGCGLTRGFHALFHGDFAAALQFNLMLPFYVLILAYVIISLCLLVIRGRGLPYRYFSPRIVYGFLALSIIFGVLRNLPMYPFSLFAV